MRSTFLFVATFSAFLLFLQNSSAESKPKITTLNLAENLYLLMPPEESPSGNVVVLIGSDGVLLVDSGLPNLASAFQEAIDALKSPNPTINYIINTHWHRDHTGGNQTLGKGATIISQENARKLMSSKQTLLGSTIQSLSEAALPSVTFKDTITLHFNGEEIRIEHYPNAHTDDDAVIKFTNANVMEIGDIYYGKVLPWVDSDHGGSLIGLREALHKLISLPESKTIVPGHEKIIGIKELEQEQLVIDESFALVEQGIAEGKTLAEIQKKGIGEKWKSWEWVGNSIPRWIESVYQSVQSKHPKPGL
ncbi:MAG: MBL fold metallo-hydrolase [Verrucomicrobiota bacterium]